jgi:hypothetical protein
MKGGNKGKTLMLIYGTQKILKKMKFNKENFSAFFQLIKSINKLRRKVLSQLKKEK